MPYYILPYNQGYIVVSDKGHTLSNYPLSLSQAKKQRIAVSLKERLYGSGLWSIHSVVFHKPYNLNKAAIEANNIIKHSNYKMRETGSSYRFSVPKNLFEEFRTKVVNPHISIIFGKYKN